MSGNRKSASSVEDPLGKVVSQLEKQAGASDATFGDGQNNFLIH